MSSSNNQKSTTATDHNNKEEHDVEAKSILGINLIPYDDASFTQIHYGPTSTSNWLIPNHVLMSAYPGDLDNEKAKLKIAQLLESGINCFVCLQLKEELNRFKPYKPLVDDYLTLHNIATDSIDYLHLPIPDNYVTSDENVMNFLNNQLIPKIVNDNKKCLIQCWGGHGRTGTISAILLSHLFKLTSSQALERVARVHACRIERRSRSPQTKSQFDQVKRLSFGYVPNDDSEDE